MSNLYKFAPLTYMSKLYKSAVAYKPTCLIYINLLC